MIDIKSEYFEDSDIKVEPMCNQEEMFSNSSESLEIMFANLMLDVNCCKEILLEVFCQNSADITKAIFGILKKINCQQDDVKKVYKHAEVL